MRRALRRRAARASGLPLRFGLDALRRVSLERASNVGGLSFRLLGPRLRAHRVARANLELAFPEKSSAQIKEILTAVWDNFGRTCAEYAHLDHLCDYDPNHPSSRIVLDAPTLDRIADVRACETPTLFFAAHLANWELPAIAATALGFKSAVLFRRPDIGPVAERIIELRAQTMGQLIPIGPHAPVPRVHTGLRIHNALRQGQHFAMLIDQHSIGGTDVTFFGRRCKADPTLARLTGLYRLPIRGIRAIRLPGHRFRLDLTHPIKCPQDSSGTIDVPATLQVITGVIEEWVREHPDQWLWQHRRWR
jgi:KDO2-lipid IV(A) lauroyltransferase